MLPLKTGNLYSLPLHSWFRFLAFSGQQIRTSPGVEVIARSRKKATPHLVKEKKQPIIKSKKTSGQNISKLSKNIKLAHKCNKCKKNVKNLKNCQSCQTLSKLSIGIKIVKIVQKNLQFSKNVKIDKKFLNCKKLSCLFITLIKRSPIELYWRPTILAKKKATHHLVKESLPGDGRRPPVGSPWTRPPPLVALHPPQLPVNLSFWIKMCFKSDLSPLCCSACQAPPALSSASPAPPVERGRQPSPLDPPCIGCCSGSTSEHPRLPGI